MTGNDVLLDTNVVIELFKGDSSIFSNIESALSVSIPFAVLGELYLGAFRSKNPQKHNKQISDFLKKCYVLVADDITANHYALLKTELLNKGKPIPENDIWIAACTKQHELILVTRDKHFNEIDGLQIEHW
jgi:tRNA(fMet)-specific endonuclease VapC